MASRSGSHPGALQTHGHEWAATALPGERLTGKVFCLVRRRRLMPSTAHREARLVADEVSKSRRSVRMNTALMDRPRWRQPVTGERRRWLSRRTIPRLWTSRRDDEVLTASPSRDDGQPVQDTARSGGRHVPAWCDGDPQRQGGIGVAGTSSRRSRGCGLCAGHGRRAATCRGRRR